MSGYKPGYSEAHSPYWVFGTQDGQRDRDLLQCCPPNPPLGPDPDKAHSAMYMRGYDLVMDGVVPHSCPLCNRQERDQLSNIWQRQ